MAIDKTQIKGGLFDVFLAARVSSETAPAQPTLATVDAGGDATWIYAGALSENQPTLDAGTPNVINLHDGTQKQLSVPWKLEFEALQLNKLSTFEGMLDSYVDAIFVKRGTSSATRYNRLGLAVGYKHGSTKEASRIPVTLTAVSGKVSDLRSEITLI